MMSSSWLVATDKIRVSTYLDPEVKADLERLASTADRSVSNMIEVLVKEAIAKAKAKGEL